MSWQFSILCQAQLSTPFSQSSLGYHVRPHCFCRDRPRHECPELNLLGRPHHHCPEDSFLAHARDPHHCTRASHSCRTYLAGLTAKAMFLHIILALGFTDAGIVTGSWAATLMASYGGFVPAASACSILQSIGASQSLAALATVAASPAAAAVIGVAVIAGGLLYFNTQENEHNK